MTALSRREAQAVELLVTGKTNIEIGNALSLSPKTVKNHIAAVMLKLGVETRTAIAHWFYSQRIACLEAENAALRARIQGGVDAAA